MKKIVRIFENKAAEDDNTALIKILPYQYLFLRVPYKLYWSRIQLWCSFPFHIPPSVPNSCLFSDIKSPHINYK